MSSKKQRNKDKVSRAPKKYTVRYTKGRRVTYVILDILCFYFGAVLLYSITALSPQTEGYKTNLAVTLILGIVMLLIGIFYYPGKFKNYIAVDGIKIEIHRVFHKTDTITFRDVKQVVNTDGKQPAYNRGPKHYTVLYGNGKSYPVIRDAMEHGEEFYKDLKSHGIVIKL